MHQNKSYTLFKTIYLTINAFKNYLKFYSIYKRRSEKFAQHWYMVPVLNPFSNGMVPVLNPFSTGMVPFLNPFSTGMVPVL